MLFSDSVRIASAPIDKNRGLARVVRSLENFFFLTSKFECAASGLEATAGQHEIVS
jgi:hypothetical protein